MCSHVTAHIGRSRDKFEQISITFTVINQALYYSEVKYCIKLLYRVTSHNR